MNQKKADEVKTVKIGVISDTHGNQLAAKAAINIFQALEVDRIIHCGDIGSPAVIRQLAPIPTHYVYGNTDQGSITLLQTEILSHGGFFYGDFGDVEWEGCRIAFTHGHKHHKQQKAIYSGDYDLVCLGHSHIAMFTSFGCTRVLNPGAIERTSHPSVAVVELPEINVIPIPLTEGW